MPSREGSSYLVLNTLVETSVAETDTMRKGIHP
jgi:hypothetical protein